MMAGFRGDQASGLRRMLARGKLRVVTFAAACDGVGRSHVVANVASSLARQGRTVLVVDENPAAGSIGDFFGLENGLDMLDVIEEGASLESVLLEPEPGVRILPAVRAISALGYLDSRQQDRLLAALGDLDLVPDVILVDAAHDHPLGCSPFALAAPDTVVVSSASSASITAAYSLIKMLSRNYGRRSFRVLVNKVRSIDEADRVFLNLSRVAKTHAVATLGFAGHVPLDPSLAQASRRRCSVVSMFPDARSSVAFRSLAADMLGWPIEESHGDLEQFMRQLLHLSQRITPNAICAG